MPDPNDQKDQNIVQAAQPQQPEQTPWYDSLQKTILNADDSVRGAISKGYDKYVAPAVNYVENSPHGLKNFSQGLQNIAGDLEDQSKAARERGLPVPLLDLSAAGLRSVPVGPTVGTTSAMIAMGAGKPMGEGGNPFGEEAASLEREAQGKALRTPNAPVQSITQAAETPKLRPEVAEMAEKRNYGPEFNAQQSQEEINHWHSISRDTNAPAEQRAYAESRLKEMQPFERFPVREPAPTQSITAAATPLPYKTYTKGGITWAEDAKGRKVSITPGQSPADITQKLHEQHTGMATINARQSAAPTQGLEELREENKRFNAKLATGTLSPAASNAIKQQVAKNEADIAKLAGAQARPMSPEGLIAPPPTVGGLPLSEKAKPIIAEAMAEQKTKNANLIGGGKGVRGEKAPLKPNVYTVKETPAPEKNIYGQPISKKSLTKAEQEFKDKGKKHFPGFEGADEQTEPQGGFLPGERQDQAQYILYPGAEGKPNYSGAPAQSIVQAAQTPQVEPSAEGMAALEGMGRPKSAYGNAAPRTTEEPRVTSLADFGMNTKTEKHMPSLRSRGWNEFNADLKQNAKLISPEFQKPELQQKLQDYASMTGGQFGYKLEKQANGLTKKVPVVQAGEGGKAIATDVRHLTAQQEKELTAWKNKK